MKQIRRNVFETNSSSTHSISITSYGGFLAHNELYIDYDDYIHVSLGEFGWEEETYNEQYDKLCYLLTMAAEINGCTAYYCNNREEDEEKIREFIHTDDFQMINDAVIAKTYCNGIWIDSCDGYIDHQSVNHDNLQDFLDNDCGCDVLSFIYDPYVCVHTDNDNH